MPMNTRSIQASSPRTVQGFTLIELLVVIATIAILAGMLLSAIPLVRKQGGKIAAVNNLRQIAFASSCYMDDSDGTVPGPFYSWVTLQYTDNKYNGGLGATLWEYLNAPVPPKGWTGSGTIPATLECLRDKYRENQGEPTQWHRWWTFYPSGDKSNSSGKFDPHGNKSATNGELWPTKFARLSHYSDAIYLQDYAIDYDYNTPGTGRPLYGKYLTLYWDSHVGYLDTQVNAMTQWW